MGTDIHFNTEVKIKGIWFTYHTPNISRNYALFNKMAGVRETWGTEPISPPKGIPDDISLIAKIRYQAMEDDAHSASWLCGSEIVELEKWIIEHSKLHNIKLNCNDLWGYFFGTDYGAFVEKNYDYDDQFKNIEDVRFVFWFDN